MRKPSREEIMEHVAYFFGFDATDDDGEYDLDSYDWTAGCYIGRDSWLSPKQVVYCIEEFVGDWD